MMEFLVHIEITGLTYGSESFVALAAQEAERAHELAAAGLLRRLWRIPGRTANWGIWNAGSADELHAALASLPFFPYMSITIHPLASHPNDPGPK